MWWGNGCHVFFSFESLSCIWGGRKSACVDNQPASWLSIVGDKPPQNAEAETVLLVFASSLFFSLGWAPLSCSCPLAGVTRVVRVGGLLSAGPRPFLLRAMAPSGPASRVTGRLHGRSELPRVSSSNGRACLRLKPRTSTALS